MTASWGAVGEMWGKSVVMIVIRPQHYTNFLDQTETFSLGIFPETQREMLNYMGTVSGRTEDKDRQKRPDRVTCRWRTRF